MADKKEKHANLMQVSFLTGFKLVFSKSCKFKRKKRANVRPFFLLIF